ncbi:MAG: alpha-tubulin suppressor-like RCC1 family protein [Glaciecola sp.]
MHTLLLKNDKTVWGLGLNGSGQLGDGTPDQRTNPVQVNSLTNVIAVSAGENHSLFLKSDCTVWSVGSNTKGELGDGTTDDRSTARRATSLGSGILAVTAGNGCTLVLKNDDIVYGSGTNNKGQLGDGTTEDRLTPVELTSILFTRKLFLDGVDLYPNPVGNQLVISVYNNSTAEIYNLTGQLLKSAILQRETTTIDVSGLSMGTFVIIVKSDKNTSVSQFIKR